MVRGKIRFTYKRPLQKMPFFLNEKVERKRKQSELY